MSRFSFNVWDARNNQFLLNGYHEPHYSISNNGDIVSIRVPTNHSDRIEELRVGKDVIVLYSPGLKDKSGVEIYAGDICVFKGRHSVVEFLNGSFRLKNKRIDKLLGAGCLNLKIKVVGNIYENPELLEDL